MKKGLKRLAATLLAGALTVGAAFAAILFIIYLVFLIKRLKAKQLTS